MMKCTMPKNSLYITVFTNCVYSKPPSQLSCERKPEDSKTHGEGREVGGWKLTEDFHTHHGSMGRATNHLKDDNVIIAYLMYEKAIIANGTTYCVINIPIV